MIKLFRFIAYLMMASLGAVFAGGILTLCFHCHVLWFAIPSLSCLGLGIASFIVGSIIALRGIS